MQGRARGLAQLQAATAAALPLCSDAGAPSRAAQARCARGDAVLAASQATPERPRLFLPLGTPWRDAAPWQAKGYAVVRAVTLAGEPRAEAKRLRCSHALIDNEAVPL